MLIRLMLLIIITIITMIIIVIMINYSYSLLITTITIVIDQHPGDVHGGGREEVLGAASAVRPRLRAVVIVIVTCYIM